MYPPAILLEPTAEPELQGGTFGHVEDWAIDLRAAVRECNEDKRRVREWTAGKHK